MGESQTNYGEYAPAVLQEPGALAKNDERFTAGRAANTGPLNRNPKKRERAALPGRLPSSNLIRDLANVINPAAFLRRRPPL